MSKRRVRVALWSGILNGVTSFIAAFASPLSGRRRRPPRPQIETAALDRRLVDRQRPAVSVRLFIGGILSTANTLIGRSSHGPSAARPTASPHLGNSMGPLTGRAVGATFGLRWVFLVTVAVLLANLAWVYYRVPEYADGDG